LPPSPAQTMGFKIRVLAMVSDSAIELAFKKLPLAEV
jgi:hypothetical protein